MASPSTPISFASELPEKEVQDLRSNLEAFVVRHATHHRPVALVSSGGTVADLEERSVRCLDNFSTGLRGAISVEEFLSRGYAVVHLSRLGSASPYGRVLSQVLGITQANHGMTCDSLGHLFAGNDPDDEEEMVKAVLEESKDPWLTENQPSFKGDTTGTPHGSDDSNIALHRRLTHSSRLQKALRERSVVLKEGRLLTVNFRSVEQYLAKLQLCAEALRDCKSFAIFYLAAAVSDFYIPVKSEHKIQSGGKDGLVLELKPVPKVMGLLRELWAPDAYVVSFKLETDQDILWKKAQGAVEKYKVHMVIGNLLDSRHEKVWVLHPAAGDEATNVSEWPMTLIERPKYSNLDALEGALLDFIVEQHFMHISLCMNMADSAAAIRAHKRLQERKRQLQREMFWKRVQTETIAFAGPLIGAVLTYTITSLLRDRIMQQSR